MAQLGQAFLHASLLGTEAEATRLREIKAEYFRQKQQRAAGEIGCFSVCRNLHVFHGLQHRVGSSSMSLLQLSCPSVCHNRHAEWSAAQVEQQHLASAAGLCGRSSLLSRQ